MGAGGSIAHGCNIGHGLTGVPLLSLGSLLATAAMVTGAVVVARLTQKGPARGRPLRMHSRSWRDSVAEREDPQAAIAVGPEDVRLPVHLVDLDAPVVGAALLDERADLFEAVGV